MNPCAECRACCQGWVIGEAYGSRFYPGKACDFLCGGCQIYDVRPNVCRKFYCAYAQELFPEWMRPDKSKVIISVQDWSKGQYLLCSEMGQKMSDEALLEINNFSKKHNCPTIIQYDGQFNFHGPQEFLEETKKKYQNILPQIR